MTKEEMKELYETGDYVCYWATTNNDNWQNRDKWFKTTEPFWVREYRYKLIHKRHADIAKEVSKNPDVEVEYIRNKIVSYKWNKEGDFFTNYNFLYNYRLKLQEVSAEIKCNEPSATDYYISYTFKPQEEKEGGSTNMDTNSNNSKCSDGISRLETISITAPDGTVYEFEKPEFECELFKCVDNFILGVVYDLSLIHI